MDWNKVNKAVWGKQFQLKTTVGLLCRSSIFSLFGQTTCNNLSLQENFPRGEESESVLVWTAPFSVFTPGCLAPIRAPGSIVMVTAGQIWFFNSHIIILNPLQSLTTGVCAGNRFWSELTHDNKKIPAAVSAFIGSPMGPHDEVEWLQFEPPTHTHSLACAVATTTEPGLKTSNKALWYVKKSKENWSLKIKAKIFWEPLSCLYGLLMELNQKPPLG